MPIFNSRGQILSGLGGAIAIDGKVICKRGSVCVWYSDDVILYNGVDDFDRWALRSYDQSTNQYNVVNPSGANFAVAINGRYASQANGILTGNFNFKKNSVMNLVGIDGRGASNRNGLICLCNDSSCTSFTIYSDWHEQVVNEIAYGLFPVSAYSAIWNGGSYGIGLQTIPMVNQRLVTLTTGDWIIGWSDKFGLICQRNGDKYGYQLNTQPTSFNMDAMNIDDKVVVCWSPNANENPNETVRVIVKDQPFIPLYEQIPPVEPPITPPPILPPITPPIIIPPKPRLIKDTIMQLISFDTSKGLIPVKEMKVSSRPGCFNLILKTGEVFSAQGDTRPSGTDGAWEQGQVSGNVVTYTDGTKEYAYGFAMIDKLPE